MKYSNRMRDKSWNSKPKYKNYWYCKTILSYWFKCKKKKKIQGTEKIQESPKNKRERDSWAN